MEDLPRAGPFSCIQCLRDCFQVEINLPFGASSAAVSPAEFPVSQSIRRVSTVGGGEGGVNPNYRQSFAQHDEGHHKQVDSNIITNNSNVHYNKTTSLASSDGRGAGKSGGMEESLVKGKKNGNGGKGMIAPPTALSHAEKEAAAEAKKKPFVMDAAATFNKKHGHYHDNNYNHHDHPSGGEEKQQQHRQQQQQQQHPKKKQKKHKSSCVDNKKGKQQQELPPLNGVAQRLKSIDFFNADECG